MSTSSCDQSPFKGVIKLPVDMRYFRLGFKIPEVKFLQVSAVVGTFTVSLDHFQEFAIWGSNAMGHAGYVALTFGRWQCEQIELHLEKR